jgi:hypothetical protein
VSIGINHIFPVGGPIISIIVAGLGLSNSLLPAAGADAAHVPDFGPDPSVSWSLEGRLDDLLPPTSGPSPVTDPGINYRVADLGNPILRPNCMWWNA